jgi:hypothetical protein
MTTNLDRLLALLAICAPGDDALHKPEEEAQ